MGPIRGNHAALLASPPRSSLGKTADEEKKKNGYRYSLCEPKTLKKSPRAREAHANIQARCVDGFTTHERVHSTFSTHRTAHVPRRKVRRETETTMDRRCVSPERTFLQRPAVFVTSPHSPSPGL